jgi:hypothetical protein
MFAVKYEGNPDLATTCKVDTATYFNISKYMKMYTKTLLTFVAYAALTSGSPVGVELTHDNLEARALNCAVVKPVINYFTKYTSSASSFCSAFLQSSTTATVKAAATTTSTTTTTPPAVQMLTTQTL